MANSGKELRRLVRALAPAVVVIDTDLPDESGWLTCAKLSREMPGQKVILVGTRASEEERRLAVFVGASALVCRDQGVAALVAEIAGTALPAVG
jgi:DNA-binding NarL/FixJ family response regulator